MSHMKILFDIESKVGDNKGDLISRTEDVFIIVTKNLDDNSVITHYNIEEGLRYLDCASELIGHNIIGYDLPVLKRLYDYVPNARITDTLVMSRLVYPNRRERDAIHRWKYLDTKLYGSHSLKAWGQRLDFAKGDYGQTEDAWGKLSEAMVEYCIQDVELTHKLYGILKPKLQSRKALNLEQELTVICNRQERHGIPFDVDRAQLFYSDLCGRRSELQTELIDKFGWWYTGELREPKTKPSYSKLIKVVFNPRSRQHIAKRLKDFYNWKPTEFTPSGEPKVDESVLSKLEYPEAKLLTEYLLVNKRISQLAEGDQAWLKLERNGRIHGRVNTMGSVTSRCSHSHPNLAQIPSVSAPYGKECRELFCAPEGFRFLGVDISGLELRCLAHYMALFDNGDYGKKLLEDDIHTVNQNAAGLSTRNQAKTFIYAFLYGAGDEKIGSIVGGSSEEGAKLKKRFLSQIPALEKLRNAVKKKAQKGYLKGLDGRRIPIRSDYGAVNTLMQSAGAIICKRWVVEFNKLLTKRDYVDTIDYQQVAFVHDELQLIVKDEHADKIGQTAVEAIQISGDKYGFRLPLTGEYKIGGSWAETH